MKKILQTLFIAAFVASSASLALAWNGSKIQGSVKNVDKDMISINSYSTDGVNNQEANFQVTNQTRLRGVDDLSEIKEGDQVKIVFKESGDQKIATSISREAVPYQSRTRNQAESY
jgi:Cu/Ag efflux protein CusF